MYDSISGQTVFKLLSSSALSLFTLYEDPMLFTQWRFCINRIYLNLTVCFFSRLKNIKQETIMTEDNTKGRKLNCLKKYESNFFFFF